MVQTGKGWNRKLVAVRIAPDTAVLAPGKTVSFTASGVFSDGRMRPVSVAWQATGGSIDSSGTFTPAAVGDYQVIGSELTTGLTDTAVVVADTSGVVDEPTAVVSSVAVTPSSTTLAMGESVQLSANARDVNGATVAGLPVTWTTSNSGVASVSSSGLVRALAAGNSIVAASINGVVGKANVTVEVTTGPVTGDCGTSSYDRLVSVSTGTQLSSAITNAQPGDLIQLAPGTYTGSWTATRSGTSTNPIVLCGPRTAVLNGGSLTNGGAVLKFIGTPSSQVRYWVAKGFTVTNRQVGVGGSYASWITVDSLHVYDIGEAAIAFQQFSSHNTWVRNYIHDTGKTTAQYGEGFYIGSYNTRWVNGQPDRTDYNTISNNIIGPNIGSELIQIDEGTTGTVVTGNRLNRAGRGYSGSGASIFVIGNDGTYFGNVITNVSGSDNGVYVETVLSGWGENNSFDNNAVTGTNVAGYGFKVRSTSNTVKCTNAVTGFDGFSNMSCTR